jgi:DNA-binding NtrC family response regulator
MSPRSGDTISPEPGKTRTASVTVFHVGPQDQDLRALAEILDRSDWQMCPGTTWKVAAAEDLPSAEAGVQGQGVPIVLCERESQVGTWKDVLERVGTFSVPPLVIVASRTADEYLWAEALNLGAYDVLSKPYHPAEVVRVLSLAWLHWENRPTARVARAS